MLDLYCLLLKRLVEQAQEVAGAKRDLEEGVVKLEALNQELKRTRKELKWLVHVESELWIALSHEVGNSLTSIIGTLHILIHDPPQESRGQKEFLELARQNSARIERLISNLIDLGAIEAGTGEAYPSPVDLLQLIIFSMQRVRGFSQEKGIDLKSIMPRERPLVFPVDEYGLKRVMINLLDNAIKFTPEGGTIRVEVVDRQDEVLVTVADNGVGIPPKHLEKIFEKFYRFTHRWMNQTAGLGIGLHVCKVLVEKQGGTIWVESELGKGSVFSFTIRKHRVGSPTS